MHTKAGITLIELLVTTSIIMILLLLGPPMLQQTVSRGRAVTGVNELIGMLRFARQQAVMDNEDVSVCARNAETGSCERTSRWGGATLMAIRDNDADAIPDGGGDGVLRVMLAGTGISYQSESISILFEGSGESSGGRIGVCVAGREDAQAVWILRTGATWRVPWDGDCE